MNLSKISPVPGLERGLAVLELMTARRVALRAIDISQELKIPKNSVSRLLQVLTDRGYLYRDEASKTFLLSRKLLAMGSTTVCESRLIDESLVIMRELRDATKEMVILHVQLDDKQGVALNTLSSLHQIRLMVDPGTHFELYNTAPGKLILAYLPEQESERIVAGLKLVRVTERTITSREKLREEVREARRRGYAFDRGECVEGVLCVSAPIFDRNRMFAAALTVSGPTTHLTMSKLKEYVPLVVNAAGRISKKLGCETLHW